MNTINRRILGVTILFFSTISMWFADTSHSEEYYTNYYITESNIISQDNIIHAKHQEIWDLFVAIVPKTDRKTLIKYIVYDNQEDNMYGYVSQDQWDPSKWNLTININKYYDEYWKLKHYKSIYALTHEFWHIFTLNDFEVEQFPINLTQQDQDTFIWKCKTYLILEGCVKQYSYINKFIDKFWKENFERSQNRNWYYKEDFYSDNETKFVTQYASYNPWEDLAETFTAFIYQAKPKWITQAEKKILFLYEYRELVLLREQIHQRIRGYKKRLAK